MQRSYVDHWYVKTVVEPSVGVAGRHPVQNRKPLEKLFIKNLLTCFPNIFHILIDF